MRTFLIVLAVLVVIVLGVGVYVLLSPDAQNVFRATAAADAEMLAEVVGFAGPPYKDDYDTTRVTGYVDNFSAEELASVTVEVQLLNDSGERMELVTFDVEDIGPGNRKTFDVSAGTLAGPRTAEITIVSAEVYE